MIQFLACVLILTGLLEWYTHRDALRHVNFTSKSETDRTEPAAPFHVMVTAENTGRLPIGFVRAEVRYPQEMELPVQSKIRHVTSERLVTHIFTLKRRQRVTRTMEVHIDRRGCYRMLGARLYRGDFIGITEQTARYEGLQEIVVYPVRVGGEQLQKALTGLIGDMISRRYLLQDPILAMGLREYVPGDPVRSINWKQTARRGQLMVREFEYTREEACRVILCLPDLERIGSDLLDTCCGLVRSICEELTRKGITAVFYTNSSPYGLYIERSFSCTVQSRSLPALLDALGRLTDMVTCRQEQLINDCMRGLEKNQEYILVVPRATDQAKRAAAVLEARSNRRVTLLAGEEWNDDRAV
ncbi:MAG: DUF58 domain-containing protein [Lachnospiraceae bacterium]|nr:DUF58 domain-containing protein [Lachnospiraceae bacterium]